jgi:signal transduction histidine kinase
MGRLEAALAPIFGGLPDAYCVSDASGRLLYMNPAAGALLGLDPAAPAPPRVCDLLCAQMSRPGGPPSGSPCPLHAPDPPGAVTFEGSGEEGRARGLRVRCERFPGGALTGSNEELRLVHIEDAREEREARERGEQWRRMAAHDLRVPLTCALGALKLLAERPEGDALTASDRQLIELGARSCERAAELAEQLVEVTRLERALGGFSRESVDLSAAASEAMRELMPAARAKRVALRGLVPAGTRAAADPALLHRVLVNLLDNAVRACREGGAVSVETSPAPEGVALSVADEGPGVADALVPNLFSASAKDASRPGRMGLGLCFCRAAARGMAGDLALTANGPAGARFTLTLPAGT